MRGVRICAWLTIVLVLLPITAAAEQRLRVTPLARDGRVLVSFQLSDAFDDDTRAAIHSGLTISFIYDVELKRGSTMWLDRTIASAAVTASVRYDNLSRRYQLTLMQDGRIERAVTMEREEDVQEWLTDFDRLPLFKSTLLEPNGEYYLRVRSHTSPRNAAFVWPWAAHNVIGHAKFTFLK